MALLAWARCWLTLAIFAALPPAVYYNVLGINDYSVGFLLALALVVMRRRRLLGVGLLAGAAAIKPYAAAWFLPAIGYTGIEGALVLAATSLALWAPVLFVWSPASYARSTENVEHLRQAVGPSGTASGAVDLPLLRWSAIPLEAIGLLARRWDHMVLTGALVFVVFLFFSPWTHWGYWIAVAPLIGLAIEWRTPSQRHAAW